MKYNMGRQMICDVACQSTIQPWIYVYSRNYNANKDVETKYYLHLENYLLHIYSKLNQAQQNLPKEAKVSFRTSTLVNEQMSTRLFTYQTFHLLIIYLSRPLFRLLFSPLITCEAGTNNNGIALANWYIADSFLSPIL